MAATIARAFGNDSTRTKETHRLGGQSSTAQANTWSTFTTAHVNRDGSGYVEVSRNGKTLHRFDFGPERES
jgi:hypothetical protein